MDTCHVMSCRIRRGDMVDNFVEQGMLCQLRSHPEERSHDFRRDERAGIKADRTCRYEALPAYRDQVGRARPSTDKIDRHSPVPSTCLAA